MLVYRVEDAQGYGPYSGNSGLDRMWDAHTDESHPCPRDDGMIPVARWEIFGFDTLDKLYEWFQGFEDDLAQAGFAVTVYEVDEWRLNRGRKQVTFNREMSSYVGAYPIRECLGQGQLRVR